MRGYDNGSGAADFGEFLHAHCIGENVTARAAVFLGEVNAHHTEFRHFFHGLHRETFRFIDFLRQRFDLIFGKLPVHFAEHQLLICQMKIHIVLPLLSLPHEINFSETPSGAVIVRMNGFCIPDNLRRILHGLRL